nr:Chain D, MVM NES mutant Nm2 [Minute virus of mice]
GGSTVEDMTKKFGTLTIHDT